MNDSKDWELKLSTTFYSSNKKNLFYEGAVYTGEQIGNIHFGYVGRSLYSRWFLHFGAGLNQMTKGIVFDDFSYFFDQPDNYAMINIGVDLYEERHSKR